MAKKDGGGIQQAAGLIRYFDEESEDAWKITPRQIYLACIGLAGFIYLVNEGVVSWIMGYVLNHLSGSIKTTDPSVLAIPCATCIAVSRSKVAPSVLGPSDS